MKLPKANIVTIITTLIVTVNIGIMLTIRFGYDFTDTVPITAAMMGWVSSTGAWGVIWAIFRYGPGKEKGSENGDVHTTINSDGTKMYVAYPAEGYTVEYDICWSAGVPTLEFMKKIRSR